MRAKTFKSEYLLGGRCKVSSFLSYRGESAIKIDFQDYTSGATLKMSYFHMWDFVSMRNYIERHATPYYADKIIDYIKKQIG